MLKRDWKIKDDSRLSVTEDGGRYSICKDFTAKRLPFIFFYLLSLSLSFSIYSCKASYGSEQDAGCVSANISSFAGNVSDSEAIATAFKYLSKFTQRKLIIDVDVHIDNAILLPSNTILELQADIYQNDKYYDALNPLEEHSDKLYGNFDNVIRGANVTFDEDAIARLPALTYTAMGYVKGSKKIDHYVPIVYPKHVDQLNNIKIVGNNHKIVASKHVPIAYHTRITGGGYVGQEGEEEMRGDDWGSRGILMAFSNCKDVYIENVTLCDAHCYALSFDLCQNVEVKNISIYSPVDVDAEEDGIDIRTGCKHFNIDGVYAETGDDAIAINAGMYGGVNSRKYPLGNNRYLYPLEASINNYQGITDEDLDVCDIVVRNVKSKRVHWDGRTAIILADLGRTVSNVLFENFEELEGNRQRPENPTIRIYNITKNRTNDLLGKISDVKIVNVKAVTSNVVVKGELDCTNINMNNIVPKKGGRVYDFTIPGTSSKYKGYKYNQKIIQ